jgi:hypothetical protein
MILLQNISSMTTVSQRKVDFIAESLSIPNTTSPVVSAVEFFDNEVEVTQSGSTWNDWQIIVNKESPVFTNSTPSIASVSPSGLVTRTTDGVARVRVSSGPNSRAFNLNVTATTGQVSRLAGYVPGSPAKAVTDELLALISSTSEKAYFSTYNHATGVFVKNADCFLASVDLTGVGLGTDIFGSFSSANRGCAVTRRHFLAARHWLGGTGFSIGNKVRFIDNTGALHERTIIGTSSTIAAGDIIVGTLNADLPLGVSPLPVAGSWVLAGYEYKPGSLPPVGSAASVTQYYTGGVGFSVNNNHECRLFAMRGIKSKQEGLEIAVSSGGETYNLPIRLQVASNSEASELYPVLEDYVDFYGNGVSGDSGGPLCFLTQAGPVLLTTWNFPTSGPFVGVPGLVNALIASADANAGISTGYTVTVAPNPVA